MAKTLAVMKPERHARPKSRDEMYSFELLPWLPFGQLKGRYWTPETALELPSVNIAGLFELGLLEDDGKVTPVYIEYAAPLRVRIRQIQVEFLPLPEAINATLVIRWVAGTKTDYHQMRASQDYAWNPKSWWCCWC